MKKWYDTTKNHRKNHTGRAGLAMALAVSLTASGLTLTPLATPGEARVATALQNPRTDADGTTTWDCVWFGNYWQNDTNGDGKADQNDAKEPIKWRVLSVDGDDAFLLADQSLDCKPYNTSYTSVTWETCTLRSWLNGYGSASNAYGTDYSGDNFMDTACSQAEQGAIRNTTVTNEDNPDYGTEGGSNTTDRIYLLSIAEVSQASYGFHTEYRTVSDTRIAVDTAYAKEQWTDTHSDTWDYGCWWLRSPGDRSNYAADVMKYSGWGSISGHHVSDSYGVVRPALHLNLKASSDAISSNLYTYAGTVSSAAENSGEKQKLQCAGSCTMEAGQRKTLHVKAHADDLEQLKSLAWRRKDKK